MSIRERRGVYVPLPPRHHRPTVNKLEAGRYDPTVGVLQRLARALGVKVTELLE